MEQTNYSQQFRIAAMLILTLACVAVLCWAGGCELTQAAAILAAAAVSFVAGVVVTMETR